jgi:hypothetical protein
MNPYFWGAITGISFIGPLYDFFLNGMSFTIVSVMSVLVVIF